MKISRRMAIGGAVLLAAVAAEEFAFRKWGKPKGEHSGTFLVRVPTDEADIALAASRGRLVTDPNGERFIVIDAESPLPVSRAP